MRRQDKFQIPSFLRDCFDIIVNNADSEGIFRLSGMAEELRESAQSLDRGVPFDKSKYEEHEKEHAASGIIKQFLRDMPDSLLTGPLSDEMVARLDDYDMGEKVLRENPNAQLDKEQLAKGGKILKEMCLRLPIANQVVLRELLKVLDVVVGKVDQNKMGPQNLAVVFTPNVLAATTTFHPSNVAVFERMIVCRAELIQELGKNPPITTRQPTYAASLRRWVLSPRKNEEEDDEDDKILGGGGGK
eukprot:CAMPEP_0201523928 /NCGR_PEP_ID=MMETSP0161_2-20130828/21008_1 /ASSEMBLY_ACC=CAM_ASM_000251 /TAXON_ID=180227 /ORGANISM="Neoparamoeba aestuarina, Strain SoJaBio B1-5/56/2" /LENGTH=244 /DNA_ID=CAMNT_0047923165 /DNA_START=145 /DNA_END=876 /DNA_ORIENTATION=-